MTDQDVSTALAEELNRIAPDVSLADIDLAGDLREEFDIDSMDFLTLVPLASGSTSICQRLTIPRCRALLLCKTI